MDLGHPRHGGDRRSHSLQGQVLGHAFQQDMGGVLQEHPGARQHPQTDADRDHRINPGPARQHDEDGPADHPDGTQHVGPDLEIGPLHIQAGVRTGGQQPHRHQVHDQAQGSHDQHPDGADGFGREKAQNAFIEDVARHQKQQDGVEGGGEDFEPTIAEGPHGVCRPLANLDRRQRDRQRSHIGEHMGGVR
uniref:Uncharacterized protein n=1 Tax=Parastrongyloides trichosuri TaxID=131310 RepID=A0A0N4Z8D5_PARTI